MRRFFTLLVAATTATLSVVGCGSDDDGAGAGNTAGAGGGSAVTQCVGSNSDFTPSEYIAQTVAGKACADESDATTVCANNLPVIGGACGKTCLGMGSDAEQATCVAECIAGKLSAGSAPFSDSCMACYTSDVECARKSCAFECVSDPTAEKCAICRADAGCTQAFFDCSGLPVAGVPSGAGGDTSGT